jgi:hypothetical protein
VHGESEREVMNYMSDIELSQYPDIDEDFSTPSMNAEAEEELDIEVNEAEPYVQLP